MDTPCVITTSVWTRQPTHGPYNHFQDITPSFLTQEGYPTAYKLYRERVKQLSAELPSCHPDTGKPVDIVRLKICLTSPEEPVDCRNTTGRSKNQVASEHRQYALFEVPAALGKAASNVDLSPALSGPSATSCSRKRQKVVYVAPTKVLLEVSTYYRFVNINNGLVNTFSIWEPTWTFVTREILARFNGRKVQVRVHGGSQYYDGEKRRNLVAAFFDSMIPTVQGSVPTKSVGLTAGPAASKVITGRKPNARSKASSKFKSKWETIDNRENADSSSSVLAMDY